jgi:hypothetical protein
VLFQLVIQLFYYLLIESSLSLPLFISNGFTSLLQKCDDLSILEGELNVRHTKRVRLDFRFELPEATLKLVTQIGLKGRDRLSTSRKDF